MPIPGFPLMYSPDPRRSGPKHPWAQYTFIQRGWRRRPRVPFFQTFPDLPRLPVKHRFNPLIRRRHCSTANVQVIIRRTYHQLSRRRNGVLSPERCGLASGYFSSSADCSSSARRKKKVVQDGAYKRRRPRRGPPHPAEVRCARAREGGRGAEAPLGVKLIHLLIHTHHTSRRTRAPPSPIIAPSMFVT